MSSRGEIPVFYYTPEDVLSHDKSSQILVAYIIVDVATIMNLALFDILYCSLWDKAMATGSVFRYPLTDIAIRNVPGTYGFVVQKNTKRITQRRSPAEMKTLNQVFDQEKFNFNKIIHKEILFYLNRKCHGSQKETSYMFVVNVSPIQYGHVLMVPEPLQCLPQIFTQESLEVCLEVLTLSTQRGMCMVANSLLAYASVNHLHYHFLQLDYPLLAAAVRGESLAIDCFELTGHPVPSLGFYASLSSPSMSSSSTLARCAKQIYVAIEVMLKENIPHNLFAMRGSPFSTFMPSIDTGIRIILVPKSPAFDTSKVHSDPEHTPPFFAAACELGGFIQIVDDKQFSKINEEEIVKVLQSKGLDLLSFKSLKEKIKIALLNLIL